jgi:hypothetical protein
MTRDDELAKRASDYWDSVAPTLERLGALDGISVNQFQLLCLCYAKWIITDYNKAWFRELMCHLNEWGLTPKARNFRSPEEYWAEKLSGRG